jgi:hypothetical protein
MATIPKLDERERRAQNCLAKAAYCKWVADFTPDQEFKRYCIRFSVQWQKEAKAAKPNPNDAAATKADDAQKKASDERS